jgi:hypothetical protein
MCIVFKVVCSGIYRKSNHKELASEPANNCCSLYSLKIKYILSNSRIPVLPSSFQPVFDQHEINRDERDMIPLCFLCKTHKMKA